jgi:hypothetical protein
MTTTTRSAPESQSGQRKAENPRQYQRFRQAAREYETDESRDAFERAFQAIARTGKRRSTDVIGE